MFASFADASSSSAASEETFSGAAFGAIGVSTVTVTDDTEDNPVERSAVSTSPDVNSFDSRDASTLADETIAMP